MWSVFLLASTLFGATLAQFDPNCDGKQVIVHLFEWKWRDIALECERFLGPNGFCGVQISPPMEHAVIGEAGYPWYQRYQPVSYKLVSRSGNEQDFADMVSRCNAAGVRIYADVVLNHMTGAERSGTGSGGSSFDGGSGSYPGVPYGSSDFTPRDWCNSPDGNINNYNDPTNVRNCKLVNLIDLWGGQDWVQQKTSEFLNHMVDLGVAGFRVDAAKHMWPGDMEAMMNRVRSLNHTHGFKQGGKPFFFHEVIDFNGEAIKASEYFHLGRVTEFRYCAKIAAGVNNFYELNNLVDYGWGMAPEDKALVFVDNHDNQRGHGGAGEVITHKNPYKYKQAVAYMLAHAYGFTRIMSSYYFDNTDQGPPGSNGNTDDVQINGDGSCGGGWVCEHRWPSIYNMVKFRNTAGNSAMTNYVNENGIVAFSRGDRAFFAMSDYSAINRSFQTGLPAGHYCNIIDNCSTSADVGNDGNANINISTGNDPAIFGMCVGC